MTPKRNRRKLRNFIVHKKQLAIVVISAVYFFLALIAILTIVIAPLYSAIFQSNEFAAQRESAKIFILLSEKLAVSLSVIFILTILPLIWGTHRLFGPLINFSNIFKKVSRGDLTAQVFLRSGDLLKSEARLANEMIQSLSRAIAAIKAQNHQLVLDLKATAEARDNQNRPHDALNSAMERAEACERLLAEFTTAAPDPDQPGTADLAPASVGCRLPRRPESFEPDALE